MLYGRQEIRLPARRPLRVYAPANGYVIARYRERYKLSVRVVFTVTAIWSLLSNRTDCLGVIWSSLTGN
jgi:hypothetical protein